MTSIAVAAGRLRHRVELQKPTDSRDTMGGVTKTWAKEISLHAEVQPQTARETVSGDQITQDVTHIIRTRYIPHVGITPSKRFKWGSRVFNIKQVINAQERNTLMEILAVEDLNAS